MDPRVTPTDMQAIEREAADFLQRAVKRAERAGGVGCAISFVVLVLAVITTPLHGGVAFFFAAFLAMVILAVAANKARKASVDDFRATFSSLAQQGVRRDLAVQYLKRQVSQHSKTKPGRVAGEVVAAIGRLQEAAPQVKRDVMESIAGAQPRVVVEGVPRQASSREESAGPARARFEIEFPDPQSRRLREDAREARASIERVVEAWNAPADATDAAAPPHATTKAPPRPPPTPAPTPAPTPSKPPPRAEPPSMPSAPPRAPAHDAAGAARREVREHGTSLGTNSSSAAPGNSLPASAPASSSPPLSSAPPSPSVFDAARPPSPQARAGAPAAANVTCPYCGTPRDPSLAMCATCFPQIRLE